MMALCLTLVGRPDLEQIMYLALLAELMMSECKIKQSHQSDQ
jgi:hypothetical protein